MKDRADFARKGIGRGRSVVVVQYEDGILFVAENPSHALHKISEIYDRVGFAAVGRYNEFENLRIAGVRLADMRGYAYDRADVTGRGLANAYAQTLGTIFSSAGEKPYEVEIIVAEVGDTSDDDQIYRLTYDGSVADEQGFAVMGGATESASEHLRAADPAPGETPSRSVDPDQVEAAVLDRTRPQQRKFRRLSDAAVLAALGAD
jgi:proteasome alpha subunit